jgi:hypothetical protein
VAGRAGTMLTQEKWTDATRRWYPEQEGHEHAALRRTGQSCVGDVQICILMSKLDSATVSVTASQCAADSPAELQAELKPCAWSGLPFRVQ